MKKVLLACFGVLLMSSCSLDEDSQNYFFEFVPIENVELPEQFKLDSLYVLNYSYYKPSTCHGFHDLYYYPENNQRNIAVINIVYEHENCQELTDELIERSINFRPLDYNSYIFKIWQGEDENGNDVYLTYEIPVVH